MKFRMGIAGPVILVGIIIYVSAVVAGNRQAASLCDRYPAGTRIDNIEEIEGTFFLTRMGDINPNIPRAQSVTYCSPLTMCDTSCRLEIEGQVVKSAKHSNL